MTIDLDDLLEMCFEEPGFRPPFKDGKKIVIRLYPDGAKFKGNSGVTCTGNVFTNLKGFCCSASYVLTNLMTNAKDSLHEQLMHMRVMNLNLDFHHVGVWTDPLNSDDRRVKVIFPQADGAFRVGIEICTAGGICGCQYRLSNPADTRQPWSICDAPRGRCDGEAAALSRVAKMRTTLPTVNPSNPNPQPKTPHPGS